MVAHVSPVLRTSILVAAPIPGLSDAAAPDRSDGTSRPVYCRFADPSCGPLVLTTPRTFLTAAWDDPVDGIFNGTISARALDDAGVPNEVHLFARGGHGFNVQCIDAPTAAWPGSLQT